MKIVSDISWGPGGVMTSVHRKETVGSGQLSYSDSKMSNFTFAQLPKKKGNWRHHQIFASSACLKRCLLLIWEIFAGEINKNPVKRTADTVRYWRDSTRYCHLSHLSPLKETADKKETRALASVWRDSARFLELQSKVFHALAGRFGGDAVMYGHIPPNAVPSPQMVSKW